MGVVYKVNILDELKNKGYSTYVLRRDKILGEATIQKLRNNDTSIMVETLGTISDLLGCTLDDLIEYKKG